ncbi:MAG: hypothetical protein ACJ8EG_06250 [Sphingomicrobium sp.]
MGRISKPTLSLLAAAAIATPAGAAGPPIAYGKLSGTSYDLYLTHPNGAGTIKLYTGPAKNSLQVDMNPVVAGGVNELAVVESRITGFKIIRYSDAGVKQPVQSVPDSCYIDSLDYHPSNGSILIIRRCLNPQVVEVVVWTNGSYGLPIISTDGMNEFYSNARWLGDGNGFLVKYGSVANGVDVQRRNMSNPSAFTTVWHDSNLSALPWFETARCAGFLVSNCMKFIYGSGLEIREASFDDMGPAGDVLLVTNGNLGRYSSDNSRVLYRVQVKGGDALNISNPTQTLAPKATYNGWDWRK